MALIAHLEVPNPNANGNHFTSPPISTVGADIIIITTCSNNVNLAPTDSVGNTYVQVVTTVPAGIPSAQMFYASAHTGAFATSASHTFNQTNDGVYASMFIMAWNGSAASPVDQFAGAGNNQVSSTQTAPITPSVSGCLVVAACSEDLTGSGNTIIVNQSFTRLDFEIATSGLTYAGANAYLIQSPAATVNPTFSWTGSAVSSESCIASFLPAGGAGYNTPAPTGAPAAILMGAQVM